MGPRRLLGDDRLARLAADGNDRAFARIYERHHRGLYRYCRSILRNDEDAADALQNTMVKALRALPGESRSIALKPWLYRIAHNEAISLLRRRANDRPMGDAAEIPGGQEVDAATRERLEALLTDLAELPERQRGALVMRELTGLSYAEIGAALDSSPAAAKQSVYEAREALQQLAEGRAMDCDAAHRLISANDRRILRGRKLRAHLRSCDGCRGFEQAIGARSADLSLLAPPLSAPAAAALLDGIVGGGSGGSSGGGMLGVLTGSAGKTAAGSAALKATTAAVTAAVGIGSYDVAERGIGFDSGSPLSAGSPLSSSLPSPAEPAAAEGGGTSSAGFDRVAAEGIAAITPTDDRRADSLGDRDSHAQAGIHGSDDHSADGARGGETPISSPPAQMETPPGLAGEEGAPPGRGGDVPPGQAGTSPGHGGTLPPGHGETSPRRAGTSPRRAGTSPRRAGTSPRRAGTSPRPAGTPPRPAGTPPRPAGTPPGLAGNHSPGHAAAPPDQGGTPLGLGGGPPPGQGDTPQGLGGGAPLGLGGTPTELGSDATPGHRGTPPAHAGEPFPR